MAQSAGSCSEQMLEAAEAEYLTARVGALSKLSGNPYGTKLKSLRSLHAFLVQSAQGPMMNRICGDCRGSPEAVSELVAWFPDRRCVPAIPLAFQTGRLPPFEQIGVQSLRRLNGWTHAQLTAPISALSVRRSDLKVEDLAAGGVDVFASIHAEAFRTTPERQAVNQACLSQLVSGKQVRGFLVRIDGEPVAGALVYFAANGIAYLGTAATRRKARGRGCHSALIASRIAAAREHGSHFIAATATPNSQSRRNLERLGLATSHVQALYMPQDLGRIQSGDSPNSFQMSR